VPQPKKNESLLWFVLFYCFVGVRGVTSNGAYAFLDCTSLTSVFYKGKSSEFGKIKKGAYNSLLNKATKYWYSEKQPARKGNYWHYVDGVPTVWGN
jgi:hypothetical protein